MRDGVTGWGWFWLGWIMCGLAVEVYWLIVNSANTLSRQLWGVERLDFSHPFDMADWTATHLLIACTLWTVFGWLSLHLPFGIWR